MNPSLPTVEAFTSAARAAKAQSASPHERLMRHELLLEERMRVERMDATPQAASLSAHRAQVAAAGYDPVETEFCIVCGGEEPCSHDFNAIRWPA